MPWKYVANAVRLAEPNLILGTITPLQDVWTASGTGSDSLDPGNVAGAWYTTTSTIYVEESDGTEWVYVFHNNSDGLLTSLQSEPRADQGDHQSRRSGTGIYSTWVSQLSVNDPPHDLTTTIVTVDKYLQFQKADYTTFQDGLDPTDPNPAAGLGICANPGGGTPFVATSIPYLTSAPITGWDFEHIYRYVTPHPPSHHFPAFPGGLATEKAAALTGLRVESDCSFYVVFRDPTVIKVPDNTEYPWLMIIKRVRVFADDGGGDTAHTAGSGGEVDGMLSAKLSISDVVAFKSSNPSFQHDGISNKVKGPYLIVDSLASVGEDQTFRTSNRVPCAVFDGDSGTPDLYVYYVVESSVRGDDDDFSFEESFGGGVSVSQIKYQQDLWAGGDYAAHGRGIAVKKIAYVDLEDQVLKVDPSNQATWTKDSAVTGELLGLVRIWIPQAFGGPFPWGRPVQLWDARFYNYVEDDDVDYTPVKADPCAVWTSEGGIRLFFACFPRPPAGAGADQITPTNGWGIWHAAPVADGTSFTQSTSLIDPMTAHKFKAIYGKDFVVRRSSTLPILPITIEIWPDMVAMSNTMNSDDKRKFMDPDVFILPDGLTVVMLAGCDRYYYDSDSGGGLVAYNGNPLGRFEGDMADLTWPWSDAFTA